jgi:ABC-type spermidine/putrescine transport system permease subunit I
MESMATLLTGSMLVFVLLCGVWLVSTILGMPREEG